MSRFSIAHPHVIVVACLLIAVFGVISIARMPVDMFPPINIPVVVVADVAFGTAADGWPCPAREPAPATDPEVLRTPGVCGSADAGVPRVVVPPKAIATRTMALTTTAINTRGR